MSPRNADLVKTAQALRLDRDLSQHFLVDDAIISAIAQASRPAQPSAPLVEIGPGAGFLTQALLSLGHPLHAIEVDPKMVGVLSRRFVEPLSQGHLTLEQANVRRVDLAALLATQTPAKGVLVGNLPYHLTGPILFQIIGELPDASHPVTAHLEKAMLMVQKEVADRLLAPPGTSAYSQLSVQVQYRHAVTPVIYAPRQAFESPPKVDSMVVCIMPRAEPVAPVQSLLNFARLVKAAFAHRRKTLLNNLKLAHYGDTANLATLLEAQGWDATTRPQMLSAAAYARLSDALEPNS